MDIPSQALLAVHTVTALSDRMASAELSGELRFLTVSEKMVQFAADSSVVSLEGELLTDHFFEFVGSESFLAEIVAGHEALFHIRDVNHVTDEGEIQYYDFLIFPLRPGESDAGLLFVIDDQTENSLLKQELTQERNELRLIQAELSRTNAKLQRLDILKSRFLSIAAHDMRTPLSLIGGYADFLVENQGIDSEIRNKFLRIIREQNGWLNRLIHDMLDLNRLENETLEIELYAGDLRKPVQMVTNALAPALEMKKLDMTVTLPDEPVYMKLHSGRIEQVLYNLVSNSLKFIDNDGHLTFSVSVEGDIGILEFGDNGRGMYPEEVANLFKLYYQAEGEAKSKGLGLGLFIVKTMVEAHHGTIVAESEYGHGTTFIMRFPLIHN